MAKRAGTTRQTQLAKRAVLDGPTCRYRGQARPGVTMAHLSILYNLAKKYVAMGLEHTTKCMRDLGSIWLGCGCEKSCCGL